MDGNIGQGSGWQQPSPGESEAQRSPGEWQHDGPQVPGPVGKPGYPPVILVGFGVIAVLVLAIGVVLVMGDGSSGDADGDLAASAGDEEEPDGEDEGDDGDDGDQPLVDGNGDGGTTDEPDDAESDGESPSDGINLDDLPSPEIPDEADPPPLPEELEGMTFPYNTFDNIHWPTIGGELVDVKPGEYVDLAYYLEPGELVISFPGNEGIFATVEVYGPDGQLLQVADKLGEPGLVEWMEFSNYRDDSLEEAGVYVVRVIQYEGSDDGMPLAFFKPG